MSKRLTKFILTVLIISLSLIFMSACGGRSNQDELPAPAVKEEGTKKKEADVEALKDVNEIPDDGIITKAQFATVAGKDKEIRFVGETDDGITYTWIYNAAQIQNPEDQNLKIDFDSEDLADIKKQANNANDAIKMTMHGRGLICSPKLEVKLKEAWQSDTGMLLKEQNKKLAKMSDVTIESKQDKKQDKKNKKKAKTVSLTKPGKGTTTLTMNVMSLEGDSYIVGGITDVDKLAAINQQAQAVASANANKGNKEGPNAAPSGSSDNGSGNQPSGSDNPAADVPSDITNSGGGSDNSGKSGSGGGGGDISNNDSGSGGGSGGSSGGSGGGSSSTCTISISCSTILNNMKNLTAGKEEFVPSDGWILPATTVTFSKGESVHDVLKRICKDKGIHMESSYTPAYNSAYVEGINQLYEFDCGELSGWMYNVNGWFPNYGCSKYTVSDGDVINWVYTCDLGKDVGDNSLY